MHCVKSVRIRSYSGLYFPAFGLNTERYSVSLRIQSECGKMRTRITPNTDTFHAVMLMGNFYARQHRFDAKADRRVAKAIFRWKESHAKKEVPFRLTTIKLTRKSFLLIVTVNFFFRKDFVCAIHRFTVKNCFSFWLGKVSCDFTWFFRRKEATLTKFSQLCKSSNMSAAKYNWMIRLFWLTDFSRIPFSHFMNMILLLQALKLLKSNIFNELQETFE